MKRKEHALLIAKYQDIYDTSEIIKCNEITFNNKQYIRVISIDSRINVVLFDFLCDSIIWENADDNEGEVLEYISYRNNIVDKEI